MRAAFAIRTTSSAGSRWGPSVDIPLRCGGRKGARPRGGRGPCRRNVYRAHGHEQQGAHFFDRYTDSSGCVRQGVSIETWREVTPRGPLIPRSVSRCVFLQVKRSGGTPVSRQRAGRRPPRVGRARLCPAPRHEGFPLRYLDGSTGMTSVLLSSPISTRHMTGPCFAFPRSGSDTSRRRFGPTGARSRCSTAPSFPGRTLSGGRALRGPRWWACTA